MGIKIAENRCKTIQAQRHSHRVRVLAYPEITPPNWLDGWIRFCLSFTAKALLAMFGFWVCFFFSLKQFFSSLGRCWWCKISKVPCQHLREHSAVFPTSQLWSWERPWGLEAHSWPGGRSRGDHTYPLVTAQAAGGWQLHTVCANGGG